MQDNAKRNIEKSQKVNIVENQFCSHGSTFMRLGPFELHFPVVCDQLRREDNGKYLLIGVYHGGILLSRLPAQIDLSFYVPFTTDESGDHVLDFRILGSQDEEYARNQILCQKLERGLLGVMTIVEAPCLIETAGAIRLQLKLPGDAEFQTIREVQVEARSPLQH